MPDENNIIPSVDEVVPFGEIDTYDDIVLSDEAQARLQRIVSAARTGGVSAAPIICKGSVDCPFKSRCPIYLADGEDGDYPVNKQCVVELSLVNQKFSDYAAQFGQSNLRDNPALRSLVSALTSVDLCEYRIDLVLAGVAHDSDGTFLLKQVTAISEMGDEIELLQEHPAWNIKKHLQKMRMDLLDTLVATPKRETWRKIALKQTSNDNLVTRQLELLERFSEIETRLLEDSD